ncbi:SDR family NAD(P)-dependent oxidoreductase [Pseudotabrizicola alkalilacus]|uniref:SDR family NAD(P)-dependent oxidoreductase n=1 Tax=Pseudotabrizicola alkalilacus TaxID=2305252 RepID=A0A411YYE6_9RHOB|nr:SDR family NAD(P)-dependent oxidoreductase [Pseudotabrizicola alkalilacus]RGP35924.1 SDR family NAD(P)-dependent oxidoreductase [Pseudotabrizicola alkalilacus]
MSDPLLPPQRKDPLKMLHLGHTPPRLRSRAAKAMAVRAGQGRFVLQVCADCQTATYPPRDRCPQCWGELRWTDQPQDAVLLAETVVRATTDSFFRGHLPWRIGTVQFCSGLTAIAHLHGDVATGDAVKMRLVLDRGGNPAFFALPAKETPNMQDDPQLRVFTAAPKHRRILVTDGRSRLGQEVALALLNAGAGTVFLGNADRLMRFDGMDRMLATPRIDMVPLDMTDSRSCQELAGLIGGRVDVIVNTASHVRPGGVSQGSRLSTLQTAMEVNVAGLMRLAQSFGPAMAGRSDDGVNSAAAFVDVNSVYGMTGKQGFVGFAASAAARLALVAGLRGEMAAAGIRVTSVLCGPVDDEWHQTVPSPKVAPARIAKAVVQVLEQGLEEIYVGDVAEDVAQRWLKDPLLATREENQ